MQRLLFANDSLRQRREVVQLTQAKADAVVRKLGVPKAAEGAASGDRAHLVIELGPGGAAAAIAEADEFESVISRRDR